MPAKKSWLIPSRWLTWNGRNRVVHSPLLHIMSSAVHKAAKPLLRDFSEVDKLQISKKGTANFVTNADLRTEKILIEELTKARKKWGVITEESERVESQDDENHVWVIDPIDGTTNFIHAVPYFCIAVAAAKLLPNDELDVIAGVIYDPVHDELFSAEKGQGAHVNGMRLRVSPAREDVLLATAAPRAYRAHYHEAETTLHRVTASGATVRCSGAAALDLAYVAAGRYDGLWYHHLQSWDLAAGSILVREAGGLVHNIDGHNNIYSDGSVVASNAHIHDKLLAMVSQRQAA